MKDEICDLVGKPHSIFGWWGNYFFQFLIVHVVNDIRQTEIHTAETRVPTPSAYDVELTIENLEGQKHHVLIKYQHNLLNKGKDNLLLDP